MLYAKQISAGLVVVAIVAIGVLQWRQQDTNPTAPPQTSSNGSSVATDDQDAGSKSATKVESSEWARRREATRGTQDLDSIVGAYKGANDCLVYHSVLHEVDSMLNGKQWNDLSGETLVALENMDVTSARNLSIVRKLEAFCSGSDQRALAEVFSNAVFDAALRGKSDAEVCFVLSSISRLKSAESASSLESQVDRYLKYAPAFSQKALERGDPRVAVKALSRYVASPSVHPSWLDNLSTADPNLTWRVARLASLRSLPEQRARMEYDLSELGKRGVLSPSEITRADAWAVETFEREFSGQAPINVDSPVQCYSSPELAS